MKKEGRVWYVGYGSNLDWARFACYIQGGRPEWAGGLGNPGCRSKRMPLEDKPFQLPFSLYFGKSSSSWNQRGVAFIHSTRSEAATLGRAYLISFQQFTDIAFQENGKPVGQDFVEQLREAVLEHQTTYLNPTNPHAPNPDARWYGRILHVGTENGCPVLTLTATWADGSVPCNAPGAGYIKTIARGLRECYSMTDEQILSYLASKPGIAGFLPSADLLQWIAEVPR